MTLHRRHLLRSLGTLAGAAALAQPAPAAEPAAPRPVRLLLNTGYSGPQAFILLAEDLGLFRREGLQLEMTPGAGAYTAAPRLAADGFDFAYGDIHSLIEVVAQQPAGQAPVAVFASFNASPSTVAVDADGSVRNPRDLEGRQVIGHDSDVALRTFGAFCRQAGVDAARVRIGTYGGGMAGMVEQMLGGQGVHGVFGYVSTLAAALAAARPELARRVRYLKYAEHAPDLYGSVLMASRRMLERHPQAVRGMVRGFNDGLAALTRDLDAGIAAVLRRSGGSREVEMLRLKTTLAIEMAHPEGRRLGLGNLDPARLARAIALMAETRGLPRVPAATEVFVPDFLPPLSQRVTRLAG